MKNKSNNINDTTPNVANEQLNNFPGYPQYPESEDIHNKFDKEFDIDPEDISKKKDR